MSVTVASRTNLLGLSPAELETFVVGLGEKPFRARQLLKWIYRRGVCDIDVMTDLGRDFRGHGTDHTLALTSPDRRNGEARIRNMILASPVFALRRAQARKSRPSGTGRVPGQGRQWGQTSER